jgi:hypothetical protein
VASSTSSGFGPLAAIRRDFPGWHAFRSNAGRWWATRVTHRKPPPHAGAAWAMTVDGDTAAQLREAIKAQESGAPPG